MMKKAITVFAALAALDAAAITATKEYVDRKAATNAAEIVRLGGRLAAAEAGIATNAAEIVAIQALIPENATAANPLITLEDVPASEVPLYLEDPIVDGVASPGSVDAGFACGDHVHPTDTSRASVEDLASAATAATNYTDAVAEATAADIGIPRFRAENDYSVGNYVMADASAELTGADGSRYVQLTAITGTATANSTGGAWIVTDIEPRGDNQKVVAKFKLNTTAWSQTLWCSRTGASGANKSFAGFYIKRGTSISVLRFDRNGDATEISGYSPTTADDCSVLANYGARMVSVNGASAVTFGAAGVYTPGSVLMLFGANIGNAQITSDMPAASVGNRGAFTLYHFRLTDANNVVEHNLVPAEDSSGKAGLFDTVTKKFYPQADNSISDFAKTRGVEIVSTGTSAIYRCVAPHSAGPWDGAHFEKVVDLASGTLAQTSDIPSAWPYTAITNAPWLTSYTETDPTIKAWAKAATKPSYTWSEIVGKPDIPSMPTGTLSNATAQVYRPANGEALSLTIPANAELSADMTRFTNGQSVFVAASPTGVYTVASNITLCGYGTWPTNSFQAVFWRLDNKVYANVIREDN